MSKLLIAIPTKSSEHYQNRSIGNAETWLKDCPCDYKFFSDADLGLTETAGQHNNTGDPIRTHRTQQMVKYAYDNGYDYIFRTDTDAYVWVNRLLACGFENHDYMGWCLPVPRHVEINCGRCLTTAHGGIGFFLSRKAMEIIINAPVERCGDGKFWGDIWVGEQLWKKGIHCHQDKRFLDGNNGPKEQHYGNIAADHLPLDHPYISIHPCDPISNFYDIYERFKSLPAETVEPERQIWWYEPRNWNYGEKRPAKCGCAYCRS